MLGVDSQKIDVHTATFCYVCGCDGIELYKNLQDKLFGATGQWDISKCPKCGLIWLNPMPNLEDIGKAYQAYYAHQNDQSYISPFKRLYRRAQQAYVSYKYKYVFERDALTWLDYILVGLISVHPGRRAEAAFKVFYLPANPTGKLLEVGCGNGAMLSSMQELGWQVEGVDFDPIALKVAKGRGLNVKLGGLNDQHYPNKSFDAVVMSHVIEHVPNPLELLSECYRILKVGGRLIVVTPNAASWGHRMYGADWRGLEPPRHLHIFTRKTLMKISEQAGFAQGECSTTIRSARAMFLSSYSLSRIKVAGAVLPFSILDKGWGEMMEIIEWMLMWVDSDAGEELTYSAIK